MSHLDGGSMDIMRIIVGIYFVFFSAALLFLIYGVWHEGYGGLLWQG